MDEKTKNVAQKNEKTKNNDTFSKSGPTPLMNSVCWNNSNQITTVISCLINGVSTMQRDKAKNRRPRLANSWWESFGFSLFEPLIDIEDGSTIYGAVYKYNHYDSYQKSTPHLGKPPRYVIAFRGTMLCSVTWKSDMKQNIRWLLNILNQGKRSDNAIKAIENVLKYHGVEKESVWLAGHSLGAGIALVAGKHMARSGSPLKTYAFNPPHSDFRVEELFESEKLKRKVRIARSLIKMAFASLFNLQIQEDDPRTRAWTPSLYLNPRDAICLGYINDFKLKSESGTARISARSKVFGRRPTPSSPADFPGEPIQFLSSADVTVNETVNETACIWAPHELNQWWKGARPSP